ncbi:protein bottleneck [Drosophila ficusphila]|uniref:protein bottleneck n=1 Tax=Drosophila ficusphila TaxID=30025 RepID=UPI0007E7E2D3|nr:protein bottleneck [Drosophila ficusphila]
MSISTFNFQFYNYKLSPSSPGFGSPASRSSSSFISELEMDIDEDMSASTRPTVTSTPKPRFTTQLAVELAKTEPGNGISPLRPKLHTAQKRWSMELREKVLEMSRRNNGDEKPQAAVEHQQQEHSMQHLQQEPLQKEPLPQEQQPQQEPTVSDKINFFNKLTNTFESGINKLLPQSSSAGNRFIAMLRNARPQNIATTASSSSSNSFLGSNHSLSGSVGGQVPPPKPKRLSQTAAQFATPLVPGMGVGKGGCPRKSSLRRKPSMDKSRATISRQSSSASVRTQNHAIMEDLSLVVPVRLRIAEYEQRISMSA